MKTGTANLPLHYGQAPRWLFEKMKKLSRQIIYAIIVEFGQDELLRRLSDPFWFQAFGCVLGFDWHSSGLTTTTCGALKEGLKDINSEVGIFIAGGKGKTSRKTPQQISEICEKHNISNANRLIYASKMAAKVDNAAVHDGFQLYHHVFVFTQKGSWTVIQQGMNTNNRWARRYHWLSESLKDFVSEPHSGIASDIKNKLTLNLVAEKSASSRELISELACEKPEKTVKQIEKLKNLNLPSHHQVFLEQLSFESLNRILLKAYEFQPQNFEALLGIQGIGPKTLRALSLISELVYGTEVSWEDPVKFSFAHGGKDGHPFPVDSKTYSISIEVLKNVLASIKIGDYEKISALKRLSRFSSIFLKK
jgi:hypothetical protein